jgi:hypothetical protein
VTGRKDFKLPWKIAGGFGRMGEQNFDMNPIPSNSLLLKRRKDPSSSEWIIPSDRRKKANPGPLSYAPVIGITDSILIVQKKLTL